MVLVIGGEKCLESMLKMYGGGICWRFLGMAKFLVLAVIKFVLICGGGGVKNESNQNFWKCTPPLQIL